MLFPRKSERHARPRSDQLTTLRLDAGRGLCDGVVQSMMQTVAMLIAVKAFALGDWLTAMIATSPFLGNLMSLFYSALFANTRWSKSQLAAAPLLASGVTFFTAAAVDGGAAYALLVTLAVVFFQLRLTFLTAIYHENYEGHRRGTLYSRGFLLMGTSSLIASWVFGEILEHDLALYRYLLLVSGTMALLAAKIVVAMPSRPPAATGATNPFRNLALLRSQPLFGYILLAWFIFGFANLWLSPVRVIYAAENERGLGLSPFQCVLILGVALEVGRLISTPVWARLFDRVNFLKLRIALNAFLGAGLVLFFATREPWVLGLGSFLMGICMGGGGLAWNLWVTHFAPPKETHIYMSVHSFLTGVRGVVGPFLAVWCLDALSPRQISWISGGMIAVSMLMLWGALPQHRAHQLATKGPITPLPEPPQSS